MTRVMPGGCGARALHGTGTGAGVSARPRSRPAAKGRVHAGRGGLVIQCKESRIGSKPVLVRTTETSVKGQSLTVKGPKGTLVRDFPREISVTLREDALVFARTEDSRKAKQLHGLCRTLGQNMVTGVLDGWEKKLKLVGVGYRAELSGKKLKLNLGYIHPVLLDIPDGVKAVVEKNQTDITISGYDKEVVGNFAAVVRSKRPPEVYKGKGVRYADEVVRLKEGKAGKKK